MASDNEDLHDYYRKLFEGKKRMADFRVENHGSLFLVRPLNDNAKRHLEEHTGEKAQWFGGALVVEPRYIGGLVSALRENGWEVE